MAEPQQAKQKVCLYFNSPGGCRKGNECPYAHKLIQAKQGPPGSLKVGQKPPQIRHKTSHASSAAASATITQSIPTNTISEAPTTSSEVAPPTGLPYRGLEMIISGGETGADRGGLDAGRSLGLKTGGSVREKYMTEHGPDPSLKVFGVETTPHNVHDLSQLNVENSDGTVAFRLHLGAGTDRTIGYCHQRLYKEASPHGRGKSYDGLDCYKPVYVISSLESTHFEKQSAELQRFILKNRIRVLNVIGHRETTSGYNGNFTRAIESFLVLALRRVIASDELEAFVKEREAASPAPPSKVAPYRRFVVHSKKSYHDVYIGRPSKWGNPFHIGKDGDRDDVCKKFEDYVKSKPELRNQIKAELKGKVVGCFCAPLKCHGETLARIANEP